MPSGYLAATWPERARPRAPEGEPAPGPRPAALMRCRPGCRCRRRRLRRPPARWGGGLPQYAVGHLDRGARIRAAGATLPGLAGCGAAYDGIGIPAWIASAARAADHAPARP